MGVGEWEKHALLHLLNSHLDSHFIYTTCESESEQQFQLNLFAVVKIKCWVLFYVAAAGISQDAKGTGGGKVLPMDFLFILVLCQCRGRSVSCSWIGFDFWPGL